ncbi:hypothetical protein VPH35_102078 [Triticum aestivum]
MATADASKFWTTRNYILVALGGTLAVTAVVIVVSVALHPAHISFSILDASNSIDSAGNDSIPYLNLTIAAANTSRKRAAVRYTTIFVELQNSTCSRNTIQTQVYVGPPAGKYLRPGTGPAIIKASSTVSLLSGDRVQSIQGLTVVVVARVRFRIAGIITRLYEIKASCPHVYFPVERSHKPPGTPIDCALVD